MSNSGTFRLPLQLAAALLILACRGGETTTGPAAPGSVVVTISPASIAVGQSAQGSAVIRDGSGTRQPSATVDWSSSDPAVATVSAIGRIVALAAGSAVISALSAGTTGTAALTVTAAIADGRQVVIDAMRLELPGIITWALSRNQAALPLNPNLATQIQDKITMLQNPLLATEITNGQRYVASIVRSSDGRQLPIVAVYPLASMNAEAALTVGTVELALPILEAFFAAPFPTDEERVWYGFVMGNSGGVGSMVMEDQTTYESRTTATRLPYEAIVDHELSHSFIPHESLTQFLELYAYNLVRTGSTNVRSWIFTRGWTPADAGNTGVHALLDIYQLIGPDAMKRAYRAVYPLGPGYGVELPAAARQAFVDQAPAALKALVALLAARVGT